MDNNDEIDAWAHGTDTGSASVIQTIRSEGTVDRSALCRPIRSTTETGKARFEIRGGHVPRLPDRAELPHRMPVAGDDEVLPRFERVNHSIATVPQLSLTDCPGHRSHDDGNAFCRRIDRAEIRK
ncbi:hypothetical protein IU433_26180 [Nocardia puris]|uniref:hypothetical protein n=1 Tax=Nocardia puris TaxID=208602 RepID=UPI001472DB11|nr:hypothetical protein [Nocardia puris]MBF6215167.1 hypothetical protein [Nocardia puris]MBF6369678.1 hypothetical protein [Nocardia puris]MBF6462504.1 hypothetical protein [Nocardia puris]